MRNFYVNELKWWCLCFDRIGFRVGASVYRSTAESCANLIYDYCKLIIEWSHFYGHEVRTDAGQYFAYNVRVPTDHQCDFSHEEPIGLVVEKHLTPLSDDSKSDEDVSPGKSVKQMVSELHNVTGGKKPISLRKEDLRRKGIMPTVVEEQEPSPAAPVQPVNMAKIKRHEMMSDRQCGYCGTISPKSFWDMATCPSFMGSCPLCQQTEEQNDDYWRGNLAQCIYVQGFHCQKCSKLMSQEVKAERYGIEETPICDCDKNGTVMDKVTIQVNFGKGWEVHQYPCDVLQIRSRIRGGQSSGIDQNADHVFFQQKWMVFHRE